MLPRQKRLSECRRPCALAGAGPTLNLEYLSMTVDKPPPKKGGFDAIRARVRGYVLNVLAGVGTVQEPKMHHQRA